MISMVTGKQGRRASTAARAAARSEAAPFPRYYRNKCASRLMECAAWESPACSAPFGNDTGRATACAYQDASAYRQASINKRPQEPIASRFRWCRKPGIGAVAACRTSLSMPCHGIGTTRGRENETGACTASHALLLSMARRKYFAIRSSCLDGTMARLLRRNARMDWRFAGSISAVSVVFHVCEFMDVTFVDFLFQGCWAKRRGRTPWRPAVLLSPFTLIRLRLLPYAVGGAPIVSGALFAVRFIGPLETFAFRPIIAASTLPFGR